MQNLKRYFTPDADGGSGASNDQSSILDDIRAIEGQIKGLKMQRIVFILLFVVALIAAVMSMNMMSESKAEAEKNAAAVQELEKTKAENNELKGSIDELKGQLEEAKLSKAETGEDQPTNNSSGPVTHIVEAGESLWLISERYFGSGDHYMKIAGDNNLDNPDILWVNTELTINKI